MLLYLCRTLNTTELWFPWVGIGLVGINNTKLSPNVLTFRTAVCTHCKSFLDLALSGQALLCVAKMTQFSAVFKGAPKVCHIWLAQKGFTVQTAVRIAWPFWLPCLEFHKKGFQCTSWGDTYTIFGGMFGILEQLHNFKLSPGQNCCLFWG